MNDKPTNTFCNRLHRREFLKDLGGGFASLGLTGMLAQDGFFSNKALAAQTPSFVNPLAPKNSSFPGKAKSVIFLFMYGGPSQVDTFDYKPALYPLDGKFIKVKTFGRVENVVKAVWSGRSGNFDLTENVENMFPTCSLMLVPV